MTEEGPRVPIWNVRIGTLLLVLGLGLMADAEHSAKIHTASFFETFFGKGEYIADIQGMVGFAGGLLGVYLLIPLIQTLLKGPRGPRGGGPTRPA